MTSSFSREEAADLAAGQPADFGVQVQKTETKFNASTSTPRSRMIRAARTLSRPPDNRQMALVTS